MLTLSINDSIQMEAVEFSEALSVSAHGTWIVVIGCLTSNITPDEIRAFAESHYYEPAFNLAIKNEANEIIYQKNGLYFNAMSTFIDIPKYQSDAIHISFSLSEEAPPPPEFFEQNADEPITDIEIGEEERIID